MLRKLIPANRSIREGQWLQTTLYPSELQQKTWGIGLGQIGRAVALRLKPFGLNKVLYCATPCRITPASSPQCKGCLCMRSN
jgi:phosphoglycerate dehydrogenase-like enzyme